NVVGNTPLSIGVLALQGDVREHVQLLTQIGVNTIEVRNTKQLNSVDGLIIPGGESSGIDKLSRIVGIAEPLKQKIRDGFPVFGTCAGMIMLAKHIDGAIVGQENFGGLDITVQRNGFGSQVDSYEQSVMYSGISEVPARVAFIRAP